MVSNQDTRATRAPPPGGQSMTQRMSGPTQDLTGGAFMASIGGPLLLTDPKVASDAMASALRQRADSTSQVFVFGGENAIAQGVFASVVADVRGVVAKF